MVVVHCTQAYFDCPIPALFESHNQCHGLTDVIYPRPCMYSPHACPSKLITGVSALYLHDNLYITTTIPCLIKYKFPSLPMMVVPLNNIIKRDSCLMIVVVSDRDTEDKCILMTGAIKSAQGSHLICSALIYPNLEIIYDVIPLNVS